MSFSPGKDRNFLGALRRTMQYGWWGNTAQATQFGQPPTLLNGEFVTSINAANTGVINLIGVDANNQIKMGLSASIALTSAQLLALNTAPVTLIAAPGAGFAIFVESFVFEMNRTATAYTGANTSALVYHGATTPITGNLAATVFTAAGAGQSITAVSGLFVGATGAALTANAAVDLYTATANYAAGTGTAKIFLKYSIVTL